MDRRQPAYVLFEATAHADYERRRDRQRRQKSLARINERVAAVVDLFAEN